MKEEEEEFSPNDLSNLTLIDMFLTSLVNMSSQIDAWIKTTSAESSEDDLLPFYI